MNAQEVIAFLNTLNDGREYVHTKKNGDVYIPRISVLPENVPLFDEMFDLAKVIEPKDWYRDGNDRSFWIWTDKGSYEGYVQNYISSFTHLTVEQYLNREEGEVDHEEMKAGWPLYFPEDKEWFQIYLAEFEEHRTLFIDNNRCFSSDTLEIFREHMDASPLFNWIIGEERKVIKMIEEGTYTGFVEKNLPYRYRSGYTDMATYWKYVPEHRKRLFGRIDPGEFEELIAWDTENDSGWEKMSSNDYFEMCNELYDLLGLKEEFPMHRKDDVPMSSKDYYRAYAAMYGSVKPFLELEETSYDEFRRFVEEDQTEHHTWEVCLVPNIHLYPQIINDRFFISLTLEYGVGDYDKLVHLCLEMRKKGFPIVKPEEIEYRMNEKRLIAICPKKTNFDSRYARSQNLKLEERGCMPETDQEEFVKEVHWFPVGEWNPKSPDKRIKIGCPKCGCDKGKIIYRNSESIERLICPECGFEVDSSALKKSRFDDICKYWNYVSYYDSFLSRHSMKS